MPKRKRTAEGLEYLQSMYRQARSRNDSVLRSFDTLEQLVEAGRLTYSLNTSPGEECDGKPHRCETVGRLAKSIHTRWPDTSSGAQKHMGVYEC